MLHPVYKPFPALCTKAKVAKGGAILAGYYSIFHVLDSTVLLVYSVDLETSNLCVLLFCIKIFPWSSNTHKIFYQY